MEPDPQPVEVVNVSGDALGWIQSMLFLQLAVSVVVVVLLVAIAVVVFWRG